MGGPDSEEVKAPLPGDPRPAPGAAGDSRASIIRAAFAVFLREGYDGASLNRIAAEAGVSKPTIYAHFGSKDGLFRALLTDACERMRLPAAQGADVEAPLRDLLTAFALRFARVVLHPEVIGLHRLVLAEAPRFPALARLYYEAGPERAHGALAELFAELDRRGRLRCDDPVLAADQFAALVLTPLRLRLLFRKQSRVGRGEAERHVEGAVRLFLAAYEAAEGSRSG